MTPVMFSLLILSTLFSFAALQPVPTITAEVSPVNGEAQREGDTVSLLCRVDNFDPERYKLSWYVEHKGLAFSSSGPFSTQGSYLSTFERVDPSSASYIFNLTLNPVTQSDSGAFDCDLFEIITPTSFTTVQDLEIVLRVYPPDAFPICRPLDNSTVVVGSQIECQTNGAARPTINGSNDGWVLREIGQGQGAVLTKNVALSDNGRTFKCSAVTSDDQTPLSCNIGPLTVGEEPSVTSTPPAGPDAATVTPAVTTAPDAGLSAADISGIVVGAVLLAVLVAIHALCCRCDPRKWMNAKSYLVDLGSSVGTWNQRTDSTREQSGVEMGSSHPEEHDSPPAYNAALHESAPYSVGDNRPVSISKPNIYAESAAAVPNLNLSINLRLDMNVAPADAASPPGEQGSPAGRDHGEATPAPEATRPPPDGSLIYAQVSKTRAAAPEITNADEPRAPPGARATPAVASNPEGVRKFGAKKETSDGGPGSGGIIYADLNLQRGEGGAVQPSQETPTLYAEIRR